MSEPDYTGQRLSFLELFKEYGYVEIPLIQRDYAQGRDSAKTVRERFLDSLFGALKEHQPLSLDFVYGEVRASPGNPASKCFEPIDGQQRLTALFLLHWYLACIAEKQDEFEKLLRHGDERTPRFRYSVRNSSHEFFDKLLAFFPDLTRPLPEQIKNRAWFRGAWEGDATIRGALVMLDAIQKRFPPDETKAFYDMLCWDNCPITFDVLNLGNLGLSEEIYVKMNARGKELTGFEKFKAWLIENRWENYKLLWPENTDATKQWPILLDGDWLDLFWSFRPPDDRNPAKSVSEVFFRTFLALAVNFHASDNPYTSESPLPEEWMGADSDERRNLWDKIFTPTALQSVFKHLRHLSSLTKKGLDDLRETLKSNGIQFSEDSTKLFCPFFEGDEGDSKVVIRERLWLHALCSFLEYSKAAQDAFRDDWFRVIRNLIENSEPRQENFATAVQSISTLAKRVTCLAESECVLNRPVLCAVKDSMFQDLQGFNGEQKREEAEKARLIQNQDGPKWEKTLLEAENHPVFLGQIGLLLDDNPNLDVFQKRLAVVKHLLDANGSKVGQNEYLIARAALSLCEPIELGYQQRLEFKDTAAQWKYLLGSTALKKDDMPTPKGMFRMGMRKLIDHLRDCRTGGFESKMKALCHSGAGQDWAADVIRYGDSLLQWGPDKWISREQKIQNYRNNGTFIFHIANSSEQDIMLGERARWRNGTIKLLLDVGWNIKEGGEVPGIGTTPPFYKGHVFNLDLPQENPTWRVWIGYDQVVLRQRNTDAPQGAAENWANVRGFEFTEGMPSEKIAEWIQQKVTSSQFKSVQQS
ncbi:MAG TPA: DUF262 domain-containing protein [Verrucomicrobiota bacterium]|nr:DUF262 domain-containing protein [Verrucomicrobiota bacterium]